MPVGPLIVRRTVLVPADRYWWVKLVAFVARTPPSPKLQDRFVIAPPEVSVKVTVKGAAPLVGLAVKLGAKPSCTKAVIRLLPAGVPHPVQRS